MGIMLRVDSLSSWVTDEDLIMRFGDYGSVESAPPSIGFTIHSSSGGHDFRFSRSEWRRARVLVPSRPAALTGPFFIDLFGSEGLLR
jgi:hypothetical protein